jgi:hypothetical protein
LYISVSGARTQEITAMNIKKYRGPEPSAILHQINAQIIEKIRSLIYKTLAIHYNCVRSLDCIRR